VRDIPGGPLLRIGDDRFIPGLTKLVQRCARPASHTYSVQIVIFSPSRNGPTRKAERFLQLTGRHRDALAERQTPRWLNEDESQVRAF
jgi:hypothetical protein